MVVVFSPTRVVLVVVSFSNERSDSSRAFFKTKSDGSGVFSNTRSDGSGVVLQREERW